MATGRKINGETKIVQVTPDKYVLELDETEARVLFALVGGIGLDAGIVGRSIQRIYNAFGDAGMKYDTKTNISTLFTGSILVKNMYDLPERELDE